LGTVILSEAKLQRRPRGQVFNLILSGSVRKLEMFESLASGYAFRSSLSFNMTATGIR
jgi:hypothetical protein